MRAKSYADQLDIIARATREHADPGDGRIDFLLPETILETRYVNATADTDSLIVWFNASINRAAKPIPAFTGMLSRFRKVAHQICIADPVLHRHPELRHSWYIGDQAVDLQTAVSSFLKSLAAKLGVSRTILVGGSAGGFAALFHALHLPDSCAVALQPQTNISRHVYFKTYLQTCWGEQAQAALEARAVTDLCDAYGRGGGANVVYLQGMGDHVHYWNHCLPFMEAVNRAAPEKAIFHVDFWGQFGHASIPPEVVTRWLQATLTAKTLASRDILTAYHRLGQGHQPAPAPALVPVPVPVPKSHRPEDIAIANRIRDHFLTPERRGA